MEPNHTLSKQILLRTDTREQNHPMWKGRFTVGKLVRQRWNRDGTNQSCPHGNSIRLAANTNKSAQGRWVVSADRIRNEHILSMRSVTNGKSQSCWLAPLGWWGWLWINSTASGWPHNGAKCYVILCYTDCLFCALNKVINTWPASHIELIKLVLMLNMLTNRPMENSVKISNAYS